MAGEALQTKELVEVREEGWMVRRHSELYVTYVTRAVAEAQVTGRALLFVIRGAQGWVV